MTNMFDEIRGHDRIKTFFKNANRKQRLFFTYLFSGPEGIGKRKTALAIAAMLNCESPEEQPCGQCRSCMKIKQGNHVDVVSFRAEKNEILSEQAEEVLSAIRFSPFEGKARVFIIDNAHQFNTTSGNMLLKTLEEPPTGNYFFLISSKPDLLLSTIRSRCQEVVFTAEALARDLQQNGHEANAFLPWLKSGGGFVDDDAPIESFTEIRVLALRFLQQLKKKGPALHLENEIDRLLGEQDREECLRFLFQIQVLLRDLLAMLGDRTDAIVNKDMEAALHDLATQLEPEKIFSINELVNRGKNSLFYNVSIQHLSSVLLAEGRKVVI